MKRLILALQKTGAAPRDALEFSEALCRKHIVHEIILSNQNELKEAFTTNAYRTATFLPTFNSSGFSFFFWTITLIRPLRLIVRLFSHAQNDIFTTHFHPWLLFILWTRPFTKSRWMYAVHENPFQKKEQRSLFLIRLEQFFLKHVDYLFCYSEFIKQELATVLPNKLITVLPLGAYTTAFQNILATPKGDHPPFLFLGRLEPYKGLSTFIDAVERLQKYGVPIRATIAGRGTINTETLNRISTLPITLVNRWLTQQEVSQYILDADVLVLPYHEASQSGVISLALAAGKPVIASRVGGLPEQVDDQITGLLVEPGNADALASAMQSLFDHPLKREHMGMAALQLGKTRLSWDKAVEIFLSV